MALTAAERSGCDESKALAAAFFSNALRVCGRFAEAREHMARALLLVPADSPATQVEICELAASLCIQCGEPEEAVCHLRFALELRQALGGAGVALPLVNLAQALSESGEAVGALEAVTEAIPLIQANPQLRLTALHNGCQYLLDAGEPALALRSLRDLDHMYAEMGESLFLGFRDLVAAHCHEALGELAAAESRYRAAVAALYGREPHHSAASLELVALLQAQGRAAEAAPFISSALHLLATLPLENARSFEATLANCAGPRGNRPEALLACAAFLRRYARQL